MSRWFEGSGLRRLALALVAAVSLGGAMTLSKPADARLWVSVGVPYYAPVYYAPVYRPYWWGPRPWWHRAHYWRWHHRHWCYWHPYRCGW